MVHNDDFPEDLEEEMLVDENDSFLSRLVIIQLLQEILKQLMTNTTTEKIQTMEEDIIHTAYRFYTLENG